MEPLTKVVTTRVKVDPRIADLVYFLRHMMNTHGSKLGLLTVDEMVAAAESFWDTRHGED